MALFNRMLNRTVEICDVGPRDGLQNLKRKFSVLERINLINQLIDAGIHRIEAGSFVSEKKVPNMGNFEDVLDGINRDKNVLISGLVMNEKGVDRALSHGGVDEIRYVLVASETFSKINQGASIEQTLEIIKNISPKIKNHNKKLSIVIATGFGCPYEGIISTKKIFNLIKKSISLGAEEIIIADTIGSGVPKQVVMFCEMVKPLLGKRLLGFHFHNTRNTGYANAMAAINSGADILDTSIGGIGGCPFAPNATGNIATEDLLYLLWQSQVEIKLDKSKLMNTLNWLKERIPNCITGQLSNAGFFPEVISTQPIKE